MTPRNRLACLVASTALLTGVVTIQSQDQKPPVFRGGIDLRQLDVSVLDKNRQPVRDLKQEDFTILEDGRPQKIEAFAFVDVPGAANANAPTWRSRASSDITSNELDNSRVFVLVIDDVAITNDPWPERETKAGVVKFVEQLGPNDLVALVFVGATKTSQNFTRDKAKIIKAVNAFTPSIVGASLACEPHLRLQRVLLNLMDNLSTLRDQRRSIVYFGARLGFYFSGPPGCPVRDFWSDVFASAQRAHISVYPIDTMGLRPGSQRAADLYMTVAGETGGRATFNSNSFDEGITRIFTENSSFYLLGYQATREPDGKYRRMTVKVNRPGLEVISTRQYLAEKAGAKPPPKPAPDVETIQGLLPVSALPLRAVAVPFAVSDGPGASVAIAVGLRQPGFTARTRDQVDLALRSFTSDGNELGHDVQQIPITVPPARAEGDLSRYEVFSRVELPGPGRYELRVSVYSEVSATRGSVFVDVEVPDFRKAPVSLSGIVVSALSAPPAAPLRVVSELTQSAPTTERTFGRQDLVSTFMRVYQGGADSPRAVTLKTRILDAAGASVFDQTDVLEGSRFDDQRSAAVPFKLPLQTLKPGDHLLKFEATAGKTTAVRDVIFTVR